MLKKLRLAESQLLIFPSLIVLAGMALASLTRLGEAGFTWLSIWPAFVLIGLLWAAHFVLQGFSRLSDQVLLPVTGVLASLGIVMIYRLEPSLVALGGDAYAGLLTRQIMWVGIGWAVMVGTVIFFKDLAVLQRYRYTLVVVGLILVASTFLFGTGPAGIKLWLDFGFFRFQPSEVLKVIIVVYLASYLYDKKELLAADYRIGPFKFFPLPYLTPMLVMLGLSVMLFAAQSDLGSALLFFGVFLVMLYVASGRGLYAWFGGLAFALAGTVMYRLVDKVAYRVDLWLDPTSGDGFQIIQGIYALASGGVLGSGIGLGRPEVVPAVYTDMIFAAISEEVGLAGALVVIALYLILVFRIFHIAIGTGRGFEQLLAVGLGATIGLQALIIIAGTIKLLPLTGITLPFVSYGGSSILINFFIIGLLLSISNKAGKESSA